MGCEERSNGRVSFYILLVLAYHNMQLAMWHETGHRAEVTCIERSPRKDTFAVGYADGSIRMWSASSGSVSTTLNGHKKAVTALAFDATGTRLASGSQDTDLIVWDVVAEAGLHRYERVYTFPLYLWLKRCKSQLTRSPRSSHSRSIPLRRWTFLVNNYCPWIYSHGV